MTDQHTVFDGSIPANYDEFLGPFVFEPYAADLVSRLEMPSNAAVLEVACGTGIVTRVLDARLPREARIVATDLNESMLDYARAKNPGLARVEWRAADAAALPFPSGSFDAVVCQFGIMFVPDKVAAMREARRVLRPGGAFLFNVWGRIEENLFAETIHQTVARLFPEDPPEFYTVPFSFCDPDEIRSALASAGFSDVRLDPVELEAKSPSANDLATGLVKGNPIVNAIRERGGIEVEQVVRSVEEALRSRFGDGAITMRTRALAVTANRGG